MPLPTSVWRTKGPRNISCQNSTQFRGARNGIALQRICHIRTGNASSISWRTRHPTMFPFGLFMGFLCLKEMALVGCRQIVAASFFYPSRRIWTSVSTTSSAPSNSGSRQKPARGCGSMASCLVMNEQGLPQRRNKCQPK